MTLKKWKNGPQKLLIIGPDPFISQSSPDQRPTAQNWFFILRHLGTRDLFFIINQPQNNDENSSWHPSKAVGGKNPVMITSFATLKFIYSEKATNFCKISTLLLSYVVPVKSKVEIFQNFVAFSEYMNFNSHKNKISMELITQKNAK